MEIGKKVKFEIKKRPVILDRQYLDVGVYKGYYLGNNEVLITEPILNMVGETIAYIPENRLEVL